MGNESTGALARAQPVSLREWVREHDERWLFVGVYLGLAVGLSVFVSLFWLLAVAALHFVLELFRQSHYRDGKKSVFLHALWEIKLDVGLVLLALTLVLYIEVVLGLLGLQSAARATAVTRAGARIGTRAAAWERNIRTFLLTVDEMARIVYAAVMLRNRGKADGEGTAEAELEEVMGAELEEVAGTAETGSAQGGEAVEVVGPFRRREPAVAKLAALKSGGAPGDSDLADSEAEGDGLQVVVPEGGETMAGRSAGRSAGGSVGGQAARGSDEGDLKTVNPGGASGPGDADGGDPDGGDLDGGDPDGAALSPLPSAWREPWGWGDRIGLGLVALGLALMVAAPFLTPHDWHSAWAVLALELRPFP